MIGFVLSMTILVSSTLAIPVQRNLDDQTSRSKEVQTFGSNLQDVKDLEIPISTKDFSKPALKVPSVQLAVNSKTEAGKNRLSKKVRKHKGIFSYPSNANYIPKVKNSYSNYERPTSKQFLESDVYYIKLPPTPYIFVPGLGYISQPPSYSFPTTLKRPNRPVKVHHDYQHHAVEEQFVKVPIDFVSNGKPTSVYRYPTDPISRTESPVVSLDKGPYVFNGNPVSFYLLGPDDRPFLHRPLQYPDYSTHPELEYQSSSYY